MADPAKSDEIEDVLSSIRRLVSEHQPAADGAGDINEMITSDANDAPDRLVLTPALRVTDPEDPWVPISASADVLEDPSDTEEGEISRAEGEDWAKELWSEDPDAPHVMDLDEANEEPSQDGQRIDADAVEPRSLNDALEEIWTETNLVDEARAHENAEETNEGDKPDSGSHEHEDLEQIAEDPQPEDSANDQSYVEEDSHSEDDPIVDANLPSASEIAATEEITDQDEAPASFIRSAVSVREYEPEEGNLDWPDEAPPAATLDLAVARAARNGEAEHAAAEIETDEHDDEPDQQEIGAEGQDQPELAAEAIVEIVETAVVEEVHNHWTDASEDADTQVDTAADEEQAVEDLGESPFTFPDEEDGFVDEETLRELIAEIVREELQGELGVRITRNIRKLVRREIRAALAAEAID